MFKILKRLWEHTSLSTRMILQIVSLLAAGSVVAGTLMLGVLQGNLISQIDRQLHDSSTQIATSIENTHMENQPTLIPSEYYVLIQIYGSDPVQFLTSATKGKAGVPDVSELLSGVKNIPLFASSKHPTTVPSSVRGSTWRAAMVPIRVGGELKPMGVLVIALPLMSVTETLANTTVSFLLIALLIALLSALVGNYLVQRSLAPLREIESVAGSIAEGDLSRRIPHAPETTEIGSLSSSLNKMLIRIEQSFRAQKKSEQKVRRFVSDASHELRTPLSTIRGYTELYQMGAIDGENVDDAIERIASESNRMGKLVESLLTLARLDEGVTHPKTPVDLVQVATNTQVDMLAIDPSRTISVEGIGDTPCPETLYVHAVHDQIVQIFMNLAANTSRYTPKGSPVEICLGKTGEFTKVVFKDHGPGIDQKDHSKMFERFFRASISRSRDDGGSGLGLSIVKSIVETHDGEVRLSQTDPHGLTVEVLIPNHPDDVPHPVST